MAAEKTHSPQAVRLAIAKVVQESIAKREAMLVDLRSRELRKSAGGGPVSLCPLCGGADNNGICGCISLIKSEGKTVVALSKNADCGPESMVKDDEGAEPMAMGEFKDKKNPANTGKEAKLKARKYNALTQCKVTPHCDLIRGHSGACNDGLGTITPRSDEDESFHKGEKCPKCGTSNKPKTVEAGKGYTAGNHTCSNCHASYSSKSPASMNKEELCKSCGKAGDLCKCMVKSERLSKDMGEPKASAPVKMPGMTPAKPKGVVGVGGKQMAGQGGGDAHIAAPGMHPETAAGLADVKGMNPGSKWKATGLANLKANLAGVKKQMAAMGAAPAAAPKPVGINAMFAASAGAVPKAAPAASPIMAPAAAAIAQPGAGVSPLQATRDKMNLAADKKAAGVGWLNSFMSRFKKPTAAPIGSGPVRSASSPFAGVRGAAALARSEGSEIATLSKAEEIGMELLKHTGRCLLCRREEHFSACAE